MKKFLLIFAVAATAILAFGCKKEVIEDKITLSTEKAVNAAWEGQTFDVVFTTNTDWSAEAKADSGSEFFSLDKTSGAAGTVTLKLTVQKNEAPAGRSGKVTITAGTASETITVSQDAVGETSEDASITVDFLAKSFDYPVSAKPDKVEPAADWITVSEIKDKAVTLTLTQNDGNSAREGKVAILIVKHTINLTVVQEPESGELKNPKASYLGHKAFIYDSESYSYTTFGQYRIDFDSEYGDVTLVVNVDPEDGVKDPSSVPAGTFAIDAAANYADKTFSVTGDDATRFSIAGTEYPVIDGEIEIAKDGDNYNVKATLQDEAEKIHVFTYSGPIGEVAKDDVGANVDGAPDYSDYYTYFQGGQLIWTITLFYSADPEGRDDYVSYVNYKVVTAPDAAGTDLPTGTFEYAPFDVFSAATGQLSVTPGTFSISGNTLAQNAFKFNGSPRLTISKEDDGKYTIAVESNITTQKHVVDEEGNWMYNEDWSYMMEDIETYDWNPSVSAVVPAAVPGLMATPDTESVAFDNNSNAGQYVGYWYSDLYGEGWNAFAFGWNNKLNGAYTIFLTVNSDKEYIYEKNAMNNRFCDKPVPGGTYTFSNEAGANTLLPTARCYIQNGYTGTMFKINGGSLTITDSSITLNDVTGKDTIGGKTCTFSGSFDTTCSYLQDYSDHSKRKLAITPVE